MVSGFRHSGIRRSAFGKDAGDDPRRTDQWEIAVRTFSPGDTERSDAAGLYVERNRHCDGSQIETEYLPYSDTQGANRRGVQQIRALGTRLDRALNDARLKYQRLLIVFADPQGEICQQFYKLYFDDADAEKAFAEYQVLAINATDAKADDAAAVLKARLALSR